VLDSRPTLDLGLSAPQKRIEEPGKRIAGDAYYTPDKLARAIVRTLPIRQGASAWETHSGGGAFVRALLAAGAGVVYASDLDAEAETHLPAAAGTAVRWLGAHDFLSLSAPPMGQFGPMWIVGNPPYDNAEAHVRKALAVTHRHVVYLLRLAFAESQGRIDFWNQHPARQVRVLARRPSFTQKGTDSAAYAVFWWDRQHQGPTHFVPCWDWSEGG
jgi:hypothetical protein